ncbi:MAG: DNA-processing protein DprA [Chloroflexi bacterium]|nr:DNA-processing protein DprA [Chloroflexota bacterium]
MVDLFSAIEEGADSFAQTMSPYLEMGAYEALWDRDGATFRRLALQFAEQPGCLPSDFVTVEEAKEYADLVWKRFDEAGICHFGVRVFGEAEYPERLRDAAHPVELLYFSGRWKLAWQPSVAVVGTRKASDEGVARTRKLVKSLVSDGYTVVSGLAAGIDTAAHETAISLGGQTVAVIGTPLSATYPKENAELQRRIAKEYLLISQVPVTRYEKRDFRWNRAFFPQRNATMSALSMATVIVEAGETSGALIQARQALQQQRKLFILDSCFRQGLDWPEKLARQGAVRVREYDDIRGQLPTSRCAD